MIETTLLTLADAESWRARLDAWELGDVYFRPGYLRALAARSEGEPLLFAWSDGAARGVHVTLRRPLTALPFAHPHGDRFDAVTPYGYAGPVLSDPAAAPAFWAAWTEAARTQGIVAEFIRFHPLLANHTPLAETVDIRRAGQTVWMDLTDDPWQTAGKSRRRDATFAKRRGVTVEPVGAAGLAAFGEIYRATMQRLDAEAYYLFDDAYFAALADGLGCDLWLLRAQVDGRDAAYALCLRHGVFLHYHLSATAPDLADTRAINLVLLEAAAMARDAGLTHFHLGGGYRGEDSLFAFKAHFSKNRAPFFVGRATHDHPVVDELTQVAHAAGAGPADPVFFPPYRSGR
jgi:Acetyltransferase (GNAT) domain